MRQDATVPPTMTVTSARSQPETLRHGADHTMSVSGSTRNPASQSVAVVTMVLHQNDSSKMLPMRNVLAATIPSAATMAATAPVTRPTAAPDRGTATTVTKETMSEEHTSELQSPPDLVC